MYLELFWSFIKVGLFSVGGGYAAIPLIQNQAVEVHGWLSSAEFGDLITIAEITPGPIAVNSATFVGIRVGGFWGAVVATVGCILPSLVIVSVLASVYVKYKKLSMLDSILSSLRPAVVALIASAGLEMLSGALFGGGAVSFASLNIPAAVLFVCSVFALGKFKLSPIAVMALCGAAGLALKLASGIITVSA